MHIYRYKISYLKIKRRDLLTTFKYSIGQKSLLRTISSMPSETNRKQWSPTNRQKVPTLWAESYPFGAVCYTFFIFLFPLDQG